MNLTKFFAPATILLSMTLALVAPAYGKGPDTAPGQVKKQQVEVGNVQKITGNNVVLTDNSQSTVDATTKVVGQAKKTLKLSQVGPGDLVAVISTVTTGVGSGSGSKKVDKVFVTTASVSAEVSKRQAVMGLITNISGNTITVAQQIHRELTWTVLTTPQTVIKGSSAGTTLAVGQRIVAVGSSSPTGLVARWIHIIPGKATGIFNKQPAPSVTPTATPSATPTATPSATPTATPSATPTATPSASVTP